MIRALLALSLLLAPALPAQAPADSAEVRAVLGVVQRLFETMRTKDTAAMRQLFEPGARLVGIRATREGGTRVQTITVDRWLGFVAGDARAQWIERAWSPEVRLDGTLATVWAAYDFHFGSTPSHCGTDAVQLLKAADGWKIVSLADTYRTVGCPTRTPP